MLRAIPQFICPPHAEISKWATLGKRPSGWLWRRPRFTFDLWETDWRYWPAFEPHHYLKLPSMVVAICYVGAVGGELVADVAFSTRPGLVEARACRLVVMPEWQGAGVGLRFLNAICKRWRRGDNRYGKPMPTLLHMSNPGVAAALRRDPAGTQVSATLCGNNKPCGIKRLAASTARQGKKAAGSEFGGHFRAVQGFR